MELGFEFLVHFSRNLSEEEQNQMFDNFIDFIEHHGLTWGGGQSKNSMNGYLDCSNSHNIANTVEIIMSYFMRFDFLAEIQINYKIDNAD